MQTKFSCKIAIEIKPKIKNQVIYLCSCSWKCFCIQNSYFYVNYLLFPVFNLISVLWPSKQKPQAAEIFNAERLQVHLLRACGHEEKERLRSWLRAAREESKNRWIWSACGANEIISLEPHVHNERVCNFECCSFVRSLHERASCIENVRDGKWGCR